MLLGTLEMTLESLALKFQYEVLLEGLKVLVMQNAAVPVKLSKLIKICSHDIPAHPYSKSVTTVRENPSGQDKRVLSTLPN